MQLRKGSAWIFLIVIGLGCRSPGTRDAGDGLHSIESNKVWYLSGYSHEAPHAPIWLKIRGQQIDQVLTQQPEGISKQELIATNSYIFPGLMDMHSHVKYNVLPLWDLAKGQFLNRWEWRDRFPPYKDAVSFNMRPIKGETVCAAVRYAEVKAMTGGAVAIQGIGGDASCAKDFGILNLGVPGEFGSDERIRGIGDVVDPDFIKGIVIPYLEPKLQKHAGNYDRALQEFLDEQGVSEWLRIAITEKRSLAVAMSLLLGKEFSQNYEVVSKAAPEKELSTEDGAKAALTATKFKRNGRNAEFDIGALLASPPWSLKDKAIPSQIEAMAGWMAEYFSRRTALDERSAYSLLAKGGVLAIPSPIRRYLTMFEQGIRRSILNYFQKEKGQAVIIHLSEGRRDDTYNVSEYQYLKMLGLAMPGVGLIHGVGMNEKDLADAKQRGVSVIWSPFSNLLLYGETLRILEAKKLGVNVAIGADWSPTGGKHILDEIQIGWRYLKSQHPAEFDTPAEQQSMAEFFVAMATINAAKALRLEDRIGRVAPGFQANLTLIERTDASAAMALVNAGQEHVNLVVVRGEPKYGEVKAVQQAAKLFADKAKPEVLSAKAPGRGCSFDKAIRLPDQSSYAHDEKMNSVEEITNLLVVAMGEHADAVRQGKADGNAKNLVSLDPLFSCADVAYSSRFKGFVEDEVPKNRAGRATLRSSYRLNDDWSPLK